MGTELTPTLEPPPRLSRGDDAAHRAHYVAKATLIDAMVYGEETEALCGYRWIPSRNPDKFPVCPACQEIYDSRPD